MNLTRLFEMQKVLDERIVKEKGLEGQDLLPQKILALQVELGELANEWRGFKFWSEDRKPRTQAYSHHEEKQHGHNGFSSIAKYERNPLLEEYVDCLHFILSIGLELAAQETEKWFVEANVQVYKNRDTVEQFIYTNYHLNRMYLEDEYDDYDELVYTFLGLGEMLGFTWEQIEQAYYSKNKINHERQATGY
ncbi:hypothetical protein CSV80_00735 [Sporosarcina sp. P12(2017)]|uniref:dUTP diphosphatase n=1 Tax=unclassified Sporosarcina TaxID=2647733 RepID=UPI000C16EA9F|nr:MULTISPECIES: dUTP diphosphatase [unclassified Sporosarcina]PIC59081.1 hypothetical protein CSV81_00735 [Sporosarcina sp. P10]PIC62402.1 hypothetical protein CSV80_00735 [Sporosarcina sp. P12(2017)]